MKIFKNFIGLAALALCLGFASCSSDDDAPSYSNVAVSNSELMTILKAKGYQFDENGKMLLDDKANSTTSLDLSGTKVDTAALKELSVFPNLKELNLSRNGYGPIFHIASLPSQITGLDLQGNDIYDFDGLVTAKVENDEVKATILHEFTKLYLPASCKYNVEDLMPFYTQNEAENKTVDMQMVNDKGSLEKYNTLREVPDEYFRTFLKQTLPRIFTADDKIDISIPMAKMDMANFQLMFANQYADIDKIQSIEGLEYVINNPYYPSNYIVFGYEGGEHQYTLGYLMPRNNITTLWLTQTTTLGLDLSGATSITNLKLTKNQNISVLDLSNTIIANQNPADFDANLGNTLNCLDCPKLETIVLPTPNKGVIESIELRDLPALKKVDLSSIYATNEIVLLNLGNGDIVFPTLTHYYYNKAGVPTLESFDNTENQIGLAVSQDVFDKEVTKTFITSYKNHLKSLWASYRKVGAIKWDRLI